MICANEIVSNNIKTDALMAHHGFNLTRPFTSSTTTAKDEFSMHEEVMPPPTKRTKSSTLPAEIKRNKKILDLGQASRWGELLALHDREGHDFCNINYSSLISQLGKCRGLDRNHPSLEALMRDLHQKVATNGVGWMGRRQWANVIHAMGKIKPSDEFSYKLLHTLVEDSAEWFVEEASPQGISNAVWACATLRFPAPNLFAEVERHVKWLFKNGNAQDISNIVWGFAKVGFHAMDLLAEMDRNAKKVVLTGTPQNTALLIWACAKLEYVPDNLLSEIDRNAAYLVEFGNPQTIANTVWACATLGYTPPRLFSEVEDNAHWIVRKSDSQNVANIVWACATIEFHAPKLFAQVEQNSTWILQDGNTQAISNIVWAFAKLAFDSPITFAEMDRQATRLVEDGSPQSISNLLWACSTLGYEAPTLFAELERDPTGRLLKQGCPNQLAICCWALAHQNLGSNYPKLLQRLWARAINMDLSNISQMSLKMLALVEAFTLGIVHLEKPSPRFRRCMDKAKGEADTLRSSFQQKVSSALEMIGFKHQLEVPVLNSLRLKNDGFLAIDIACTERMIAIECDGPMHFLKALGTGELTKIEDGRTKAKRQFLERQGWTVINVNYEEWVDAMRYCKEKAFLQNKLVKVGVKAQ